jgi:transposase InsO family protein
MLTEKSSITGKNYTVTALLKASGISRACFYDTRKRRETSKKRGPKPHFSDDQVLKAVREEIKNSHFHSEGYKKIHKRVRKTEVICGKNRVYRLMKENNLMAPIRPVRNGSSRTHDGKIITDLPNKMWGTDGKQFFTRKEGKCWLFSVIDHFNDEILGFEVVKKGDRFAALEPVKKAIKREFGSLEKGIVKDLGLFLRSDHGSQYDSNFFQTEIKFLGIDYSPAFVRSPECNGIIERFHRTIQEQIFDLYIFEDLEEAKRVMVEFIQNYNNHWTLHRLGLQSPTEYRINHIENVKKIA